ncbi:hypothetical protein OL239_18990 [Arthrobacter sp. ATA002]|uniref:hypothetical protein n=1 Tax=Arthrobacter sp. ATA002 TaxID=2991715 RepID=UPI0022A7630C|nr:hypothetical protein [Arthrobacter sp. ATA002]WAP51784.1 hypothetical protein OL239_18990 [Arthrobacter sp. ATA002]
MPASGPAGSSFPAEAPRAASFFLMAAGILITLAGLQELSWLFGPLLLTALAIVVVYPAGTWLIKRRVPRPLALSVLLLIVFGLLAAVLAVIIYSLSRLAGLLLSIPGGCRASLRIWPLG